MNETHPNPETRIALFQRKEIRRTIHNDEWWFVITDVIAALTDSVVRAAQYRGVTTYQDIAAIMGLPMKGSHMGAEMGWVLGEMGEAVAGVAGRLRAESRTLDLELRTLNFCGPEKLAKATIGKKLKCWCARRRRA
jgi:hypothetical protein